MSPFQPLSLSPSDTNQLQVVAKTILDANLNRYRRFLDVDEGNVNSRAWKHVKTTYRMRVYLERRSRQSFSPSQVDPAAHTSDLQPMLCVGSTSGKLDDVMFGIMNPSPLCMSDLSRAAVLSPLKLLTTENPFRTIAVKWTELDVRLKAMGLVKNHDFVYVEATGSLQLPSGERVDYQLLHSVDIPQVHCLPGCVRAQLSVCSYFRQENETSVSVYVMGMMDPMGDRARQVILPYFVKTLLSTFKRTPCAKTNRPTQTLDTELEKRGSLSRDNICITCLKRVWRLGKLASHKYSTCNVCSRYVCSSCKVVTKLSFMTPELEMTQRKVIFCSSCAIDEDVSEFSLSESSGVTTPRQHSNWFTRSWSRNHDNEWTSRNLTQQCA